MSSIDKYQHKLIGFIKCESDYDIVHNNSTRLIAVYKLQQDIPNDEQDFDGRKNDILIGGGRGEVPAFRISIPAAFKFFMDEEFDDFDEYSELFKSFWSPTQSFKLCNGFLKMGWDPVDNIEFWLAEQVCKLLINHIPEYSDNGTKILESKLEFHKQEKGT